jgi:Ca2+-binding EF-hand superfamily protein
MSLITDEQLTKMQKLYQSVDKNGDGQVSIKELKKAIHKLDDPALRKIGEQSLDDLDRDGNGNIMFKEFLNALRSKKGDKKKKKKKKCCCC